MIQANFFVAFALILCAPHINKELAVTLAVASLVLALIAALVAFFNAKRGG